MSRWLIDRARRHGLWSPAGTGQPLINRARPELAGALAIDVSPVAQYWFDRRDGTFSWRTDVPTYRPAGLAVFIESAAPRTVQPGDGRRIAPWPWLYRRWGVLMVATDLHRKPEVDKRRAVTLAAIQEYEACDPGAVLTTSVDDGRWGINLSLIGDRGDRAPGMLGGAVLIVKEDGQLAGCATDDPDHLGLAVRSVVVPPQPRTSAGDWHALAGFDALMAPLLFANSCLSVDNEGAPLVTGAANERATSIGVSASAGGNTFTGPITIKVNGVQPNSSIVNDIMTALGQARQMQVGM